MMCELNLVTRLQNATTWLDQERCSGHYVSCSQPHKTQTFQRKCNFKIQRGSTGNLKTEKCVKVKTCNNHHWQIIILCLCSADHERGRKTWKLMRCGWQKRTTHTFVQESSLSSLIPTFPFLLFGATCFWETWLGVNLMNRTWWQQRNYQKQQKKWFGTVKHLIMHNKTKVKPGTFMRKCISLCKQGEYHSTQPSSKAIAPTWATHEPSSVSRNLDEEGRTFPIHQIQILSKKPPQKMWHRARKFQVLSESLVIWRDTRIKTKIWTHNCSIVFVFYRVKLSVNAVLNM